MEQFARETAEYAVNSIRRRQGGKPQPLCGILNGRIVNTTAVTAYLIRWPLGREYRVIIEVDKFEVETKRWRYIVSDAEELNVQAIFEFIQQALNEAGVEDEAEEAEEEEESAPGCYGLGWGIDF